MCESPDVGIFSQLTSFAGDFPVRISATLARVLGLLASARGCGTSMRASLASYDPGSSSWKTSQRSLLGGWETYSERWPVSGTMQSGRLYELPTSARPTGESGCSSWPTPDAAVFNASESPESFRARQEALRAKGINGNGCGTPLAIAVRLWPTPTTQDSAASGSAGYSTESGRHAGTTLTDATARRVWATPRNNTGPSTDHQHLSIDGQVRTATGKLNPTWVCALMGFPMDWFDGLPDPEPRNTTGSRRARSRKAKTEPSDCER